MYILQRKQREAAAEARRFKKWLNQRKRKENRQYLKEQKSGLFLKEEKLELKDDSEEDVDILS